MSETRRPRPAVLCILDGWGLRTETENNAIAAADTPVFDRLMATCPNAHVDTDGRHVGLPQGQMGNSEVGHMNLGAGRIVWQDLPKIDAAIEDGSLAKAQALTALIDAVQAKGGTLHIAGLLSPGGVHSHQRHIAALASIAAQAGLAVRIHAFLDGRDTPPKSALDYLDAFEADLAPARTVGGDIAVATVSGRFFAMDRDKRWDRVERAYAAMVTGEGERADTARAAVEAAYARGETDEFVAPTAIGGYAGMADGDGLLMANFRADRAREILTALLDPAFDGFTRSRTVAFSGAAGLVSYSSALDPFHAVIFPAEDLPNTLGEYASARGLRQLRIAETEKYAHVTFFFNGGREGEFPGEDRILVPSPKVKTYDLQPEMSAAEVTDRLVEAIDAGTYDLIVVNYANPDMVGHTGIMAAAIKAVETVDACLGRVADAVERAGGVMLVTADHGNVEMMTDPATGQAHTAHTTFQVPLILVNPGVLGEEVRLRDGRLADIAPSLLDLIGLPKPAEMTGESLVVHGPAAQAARSAAE